MTQNTFDPTKPVQTRDGRKARIICTDRLGDSPMVVLIERGNGGETLASRFSDGSYVVGRTSANDLINIPQEPKRTERFLNIYNDGNDLVRYHSSVASALGGRNSPRGPQGATIAITYKDGIPSSVELIHSA